MRIRPTTRRSRRILKAAAAACAVSTAAAGTLFATQAGAATTDSSKQIEVFIPSGVRCFAVMVDNGYATIFGSRFRSRPSHGINGARDFTYWNFDSDAVNASKQGGAWEQTLRFANPGSTVTVWTSYIGCQHLVNGENFEETDWKVPNDNLHNVWVDTTRSVGP